MDFALINTKKAVVNGLNHALDGQKVLFNVQKQVGNGQ